MSAQNDQDYGLFNQHQEDSRKRTEFLAKSVFLLSGGALSFSITVFLGDKAPKLTPELVAVLKTGWWALFASMAAYLFVICTMLIRDYLFGERWRDSMNGADVKNLSGKPGWLEGIMWSFGIVGIITTMYGFYCLATVSTALLSK